MSGGIRRIERRPCAEGESLGPPAFGLLFVIFGRVRHRPDAVPPLVALYIAGACWFTGSTSFANPAVTIARGAGDTFPGICPGHTPMFIAMQPIADGIGHPVLTRLFGDD